ncbi:hypothetical protein [Microscilla marina]|uniref:Lipoprotein, putative n=1 Tax=Microscilla marina ATCC 23134 TaxID=313606 RepID=A1ZYQ4_MICM2|nr:hypothetical protein [Microscilla marina]EAY24478.1 lipoprotein, putative [Microscilla marina ATCC 23134]
MNIETKIKTKHKRLVLLLGVLIVGTCLVVGCHKIIRVSKTPDEKLSPEKMVLPRFVANKLTQKLREVLPDTFARVETRQILPLGDTKTVFIEGKYAVGGIQFLKESADKVGVALSYDLEQFFAFMAAKLKEELTARGKANPEIIEALDLSLDILFAYYETKAKIPVQGKLNTVFPNSAAATAQVFLSQLRLLYFQIVSRGDGDGVILKIGWNADMFEVFLTDVLAGKYKVKVVEKE